jgi:phospholipid/cholesterol/gamma-HCH transport system permease protein
LALQIYLGGNRFGAEAIVPQVVVLGITRELGPVIAGLMIAGRVAAAIAAEIGTMKVTEQIDALTTLATNPDQISGGAAHCGGGDLHADLDRHRRLRSACSAAMSCRSIPWISTAPGYLKNTGRISPISEDITSGLIKAAVFGLHRGLAGLLQRLSIPRAGAQGVGNATTNAVVTSSILILAADYVLTALLFHK